MANGDAAAAAGMDLVAATDKVRMSYDEHNKTRDYVATKTAAARSGAVADVMAASVWQGDIPANGGKLLRLSPSGFIGIQTPTSPGHPASKGYVDGQDAAIENGQLSSAVYSRTLGGTWRNLYISSTGLLGWVASSDELKKNIRAFTPDKQAILAMQLVQFEYKVAAGGDGTVHQGLIAQQLHDLGLQWLVDYGVDGDTPEGVRYDQLALALLPVLQDHEARIARLEGDAS